MPKKTKVGYFVFSGDKKVSPADKRVFDKFASSQMYDNVHVVSKALDSLQRGLAWLQQLQATDSKLVQSGLIAADNKEPQEHLRELRKHIQILTPLVDQVRADRARRVHDVTELERALEAEARKQQREAALKKKKAAERHYEPNEESTTPGGFIDAKTLEANSKARDLGANPEKKLPGAL